MCIDFEFKCIDGVFDVCHDILHKLSAIPHVLWGCHHSCDLSYLNIFSVTVIQCRHALSSDNSNDGTRNYGVVDLPDANSKLWNFVERKVWLVVVCIVARPIDHINGFFAILRVKCVRFLYGV